MNIHVALFGGALLTLGGPPQFDFIDDSWKHCLNLRGSSP